MHPSDDWTREQTLAVRTRLREKLGEAVDANDSARQDKIIRALNLLNKKLENTDGQRN